MTLQSAAQFKRLLLITCILVIGGCGTRSPSTSPASTLRHSDATVHQVRYAAAELLGVDPTEVKPETSLGDLGADELDFVELVMELEDRFHISISDEKAERLMGTGNWQHRMKNVTMVNLATLVDECSQLSQGKGQQSTAQEPTAGSVSSGESSPSIQ